MGAAQIYLLAHLFKARQISAGSFAFIAMVTVNIHYVLDSLLENLSFNLTPAVASLKASFEFISSDHDALEAQKALPLQNISGEITFKDVYFAYNHGHTHIFKGLNLHIPAGTKLGIVGTSGAGKTTFVKCLLRYFDVESGEILIDGHNIKTITQESLWANISMIPQDITMFHRSILENLQIAKYDASFAEIVEACKKARIHDDIMKMAKGYESIVGERGVKVSGGQRQRIAIARAILKSAPILILDEATSALDTPTEKLIQESLTAILASSKTTAIVIAHRLSTLLYMDKIIVFKAGQICEQGTHQQLLAKGGHYRELWDAQVGGFLPEEDDDGLQK
jgi:ATP-binding cassette subfamily B protein